MRNTEHIDLTAYNYVTCPMSRCDMLDQGLHTDYIDDPTIMVVNEFDICPVCKNHRLKYGQLELPNMLQIVLGCTDRKCKYRWFWVDPDVKLKLIKF